MYVCVCVCITHTHTHTHTRTHTQGNFGAFMAGTMRICSASTIIWREVFWRLCVSFLIRYFAEFAEIHTYQHAYMRTYTHTSGVAVSAKAQGVPGLFDCIHTFIHTYTHIRCRSLSKSARSSGTFQLHTYIHSYIHTHSVSQSQQKRKELRDFSGTSLSVSLWVRWLLVWCRWAFRS